MGSEEALHYCYANNLERRAVLQVPERRTPNLLLFPLLGSGADSRQRTKPGSSLGSQRPDTQQVLVESASLTSTAPPERLLLVGTTALTRYSLDWMSSLLLSGADKGSSG